MKSSQDQQPAGATPDTARDASTDGRERKGAAMRARLRAATEEIIADAGFEAATTVEVARRCGVSRGAVLHHYPTRDDLIIDTARHFWERADRDTAALAAALKEGRVSTAYFVEKLYERVFREPALLTMLELLVGGRGNPRIGEAVREVLTGLFDAYEVLGAHAFAGRIADPARVRNVVTLVVATLRGLRVQELIDPNPARAERVRATLVEAVEGLLGPKPGAKEPG